MACERAHELTVTQSYSLIAADWGQCTTRSRIGSVTLFPARRFYWSLYFPNRKATAIVKLASHNGIFNNVEPALGIIRPPCRLLSLAARNSYGLHYRSILGPLPCSGCNIRDKSVLTWLLLCDKTVCIGIISAEVRASYCQYLYWHLTFGRWPNTCTGSFAIDIAIGVFRFHRSQIRLDISSWTVRVPLSVRDSFASTVYATDIWA
jgi:hypothetical protein